MHYSVLLKESIENLNIKSDGIYVDATLGYGGHSSEILKRIPNGFLYAFDQDIDAINYAQERLSKIGDNFKIFHRNFENLKEVLLENNVNKIDGIVFDLGLSSPQIDNNERGFSFMHDALLDMRMDQSQEKTASDIVNNYDEKELTSIFYKYGEEKLSKVIAKKIVESRPIKTTMELVKVIESAVGKKYFNTKHPERRIFQSIRIELNRELEVLKHVLPDAIDLLNNEGRICVITFHSLEDRIVKQVFKKYSEVPEIVKGLPNIPEYYLPKLKIINKKVIEASEEEIRQNSRSKSAKLRVGEKREYND